MTFYAVVFLMVVNHIAFKGSKVLMSLYAMELGADPMDIGVQVLRRR